MFAWSMQVTQLLQPCKQVALSPTHIIQKHILLVRWCSDKSWSSMISKPYDLQTPFLILLSSLFITLFLCFKTPLLSKNLSFQLTRFSTLFSESSLPVHDKRNLYRIFRKNSPVIPKFEIILSKRSFLTYQLVSGTLQNKSPYLFVSTWPSIKSYFWVLEISYLVSFTRKTHPNSPYLNCNNTMKINSQKLLRNSMCCRNTSKSVGPTPLIFFLFLYA